MRLASDYDSCWSDSPRLVRMLVPISEKSAYSRVTPD